MKPSIAVVAATIACVIAATTAGCSAHDHTRQTEIVPPASGPASSTSPVTTSNTPALSVATQSPTATSATPSPQPNATQIGTDTAAKLGAVESDLADISNGAGNIDHDLQAGDSASAQNDDG